MPDPSRNRCRSSKVDFTIRLEVTMHCSIDPPHILHRIAALQDEDLHPAIDAAQRALLDIEPLQRTRQLIPDCRGRS